MGNDLKILAEIAAKVAPPPWTSDTEKSEGAYGKYNEFVLIDARGYRLIGTENADYRFSEIHEEYDSEEGRRAQWNEPARILMEYLAAVDPATIIRLTEEVERLRAALVEAGNAAGALISPNASVDALANASEQVRRLVASLRARAEAAEARVKELEEMLKDAVYLAKNSNLKRGVEHLEKQLSALSLHKEG